MAICCAGKKQKVSHPVTTSLNHRNSSDKHNGHVDHHHLKPNSTIRHRSHSHFHHPAHSNQFAMPHDLSRSTGNSASSSALTYSYASPSASSSSKANHLFPKSNPKSVPMDLSDDDDDDDVEDHRSAKKPNGKLPPTTAPPAKSTTKQQQLIVHADMIFYCFEILGNYLFNGKNHLGKYHVPSTSTNGQLVPSALQLPALPLEPYPLFVTWLIGSDQKLRGCIGTFTPMNLAQGKSFDPRTDERSEIFLQAFENTP